MIVSIYAFAVLFNAEMTVPLAIVCQIIVYLPSFGESFDAHMEKCIFWRLSVERQ